MKNIYYSLNPVRKCLGLIMLAFMAFSQSGWAQQCQMGCKPDGVTVSLGVNGKAEITSDLVVISNDPACPIVSVQLFADHMNGTPIAGTSITCDYLAGDADGSRPLFVVVTNSAGNTCMVTVQVEDKLGPTIDCKNATIACNVGFDAVPPPTATEPCASNGVTLVSNSVSSTTLEGLVGPLSPANFPANAEFDLSNGALVVKSGNKICVDLPVAGTIDFDWANNTASAITNPTTVTITQPGLGPNGTPLVSANTLTNATTVNGVSTFTVVAGSEICFETGGIGTESSVFSKFKYKLNAPNVCTNDYELRKWTATDGFGNVSTCLRVVTRTPVPVNLPTTPFKIDCASPMASILDANGNLNPSVSGVPTGCNISYSYQDELLIPACQNGNSSAKSFQRFWSIMDNCTWNVTTFIQLIKIEDTTAPVITGLPSFPTLPQDITVNADQSNCTGVLWASIPTITDNCSDLVDYTISTTKGVASKNAAGVWLISGLPLGDFVLTYTAKDCVGNSSTATVRGKVLDFTPPTVICNTAKTVSLTTSGVGKIPAESFDNGSHDNCGWLDFKVIRMENLLGTNVGSTASQSSNCSTTNGDDDNFKPGNQIYFDDHVGFCCMDLMNGPVMVVLRVFDVNVGDGHVNPARMLIGGDLYGHYNDCMVEVTVEDKAPPKLDCPSAVTISCDFWYDMNNLAATFGTVSTDSHLADVTINDPGNTTSPTSTIDQGLVSGNCVVQATEIDPIVNLNCGQGVIIRRFQAGSGNQVQTCSQIITVKNFTPFVQANITWPAAEVNLTIDANCAAATAPANTGTPTVTNDDQCAMVAITHVDENLTVVENACYKIKRIWTVTDWCTLDQNDSDLNDVVETSDDGIVPGQWEFVQFIKVSDSGMPTIANCTDIPGDQCAGSTTNLTNTFGDNCTPLNQLVIDFKIDLGNNNAPGVYNLEGGVNFIDNAAITNVASTYNATTGKLEITGALPDGTHRILWTVEDKCSNKTSCSQVFTVGGTDTTNPTPLTVSYQAVTNLVTGATELDGSFTASDNCPMPLAYTWFIDLNNDDPTELIWDEQGTGQTFVYGPIGNGTHQAMFVATDAAGNSVKVFRLVTVTLAAPKISGAISTEMGEMVEEVTVKANASHITTTDNFGEYLMEDVPANEDYLVAPSKTDGLRNGVSTLDLVHVSRHLIGLQSLDSPYKLIAADVNGDEVVNTFDLLDLQRVLLFVYDEFPNNNPSWRFVDAAYTFPNPSNPFEYGFPENYPINNLDEDMADLDFTAVKTGDVNNDATANAMQAAQDRSFTGSYPMETKVDVDGEVTTIDFIAVESAKLNGLQLNLDLGVYELAGLKAGVLDVSDANIAPVRGQYFMSYAQGASVEVAAGEVLFTLTVNTENNVNTTIAQEVHLSNALASSEVYVDNGTIEVKNPTLEFGQEEVSHVLYQNRPNPFRQNTSIGFYLAEEANATITIFDISGKILKVINADYAKGQHNVDINIDELNANGVLIYQLSTAGFTTSKRMTVLK